MNLGEATDLALEIYNMIDPIVVILVVIFVLYTPLFIFKRLRALIALSPGPGPALADLRRLLLRQGYLRSSSLMQFRV